MYAAYDSPDAEYFKGINKIVYKSDAGPCDVLCFKHYDAKQVVNGRTMEDWLRFSVCYWHTFRGTGSDPFGPGTLKRPWDDGTSSVDNAKRVIRAAFEFFSKLGSPFWCFHDRDIAPEGKNLSETNMNLDTIVEIAQQLQGKTGTKLLWTTCNLFSHPRYIHGAATSCDADVFAYAAAQLKKGLEVAKKLGAKNYVFWGGREGYQTLLNTDIATELRHMATFFKMAVEYKKKIGFDGQFLIEPKPKEPTRHQYDYDAMTVLAFLEHFKLKDYFKINVEPNHTTLAGHCHEHDVVLSSACGMLGSIDANTGSPDIGWDTDQFPMDLKSSTLIMKTVIEQGGLQPGGLNFDCKLRRESTDLQDMFIAHIGAMDCFARGLKCAANIINEGVITRMLKERYISYESGIGKMIDKGETSLEELEAYVLEREAPKPQSGQQEYFESVINYYV